MEADWAAEVGAGLDWIDADWAGFVDLRGTPGAIREIAEVVEKPALCEALVALNGAASKVFSAKCDVWKLEAEEIDAREFEYPPDEVCVGVASYIDLLLRDEEMFAGFERHQAWARRAVEKMRLLPVPSGRVDLVIRAAVFGRKPGFGMTMYTAGCGVDSEAAHAAWKTILRAAVAITMSEAIQPGASSSIG